MEYDVDSSEDRDVSNVGPSKSVGRIVRTICRNSSVELRGPYGGK